MGRTRHGADHRLELDLRRLASALLVLCALAASSPRVLAQTEPVASLQVVGGGECLAAESIQAAVHERSSRIRFVPAAADVPQLSVRVSRAAQVGVQLAIAWPQPDARRSERRLSAASCEEASAAVAFLIALTLDPAAVSAEPGQPPPQAASSQETPPPAAAVEPEAAVPAAPGSDSAPRPPSRDSAAEPFAFAHFGVSVRAELATGVAPDALLGPGVQLLLEFRGFGWWMPALQLGAAHLWVSDLSEGGGVADFQLSVVRLSLCPMGLQVGPATARACATGAAGTLNAQGTDTYLPRNSERGWLDVGANLHLLAAFESLYLEGAAGFIAPLRRDQYAFRPDVFHHVQAVCWQVLVGLGMRFP